MNLQGFLMSPQLKGLDRSGILKNKKNKIHQQANKPDGLT
jgi:hypothetical protein